MIKIISFSIFILLFMNGCIFDSVAKIDKKTNFQQLSKQLLRPICKKIHSNKVLYVTDFVNEKNLDNNSKLGFLLSNQLKVDLLDKRCTHNNVIKAFELSKNLSIGGDGSNIFTRDIKKLTTTELIHDRQILVGTYLITNKQFIVYLKLINLKSGNIIATNSITRTITHEIINLEDIDQNPVIYTPFHL